MKQELDIYNYPKRLAIALQQLEKACLWKNLPITSIAGYLMLTLIQINPVSYMITTRKN